MKTPPETLDDLKTKGKKYATHSIIASTEIASRSPYAQRLRKFLVPTPIRAAEFRMQNWDDNSDPEEPA